MNKKIFLYIFLLCLFLTGCKGNIKEVGTLETFNNTFSNIGFSVSDNSETYTEDKYLGAMIAKNDEDVTVQMVIYKNTDDAIKIQEEHIEMFQLLKSTSNIINKDKGKNYYSYTMISNNQYMISTRIDNTLVFCKVPLEYKDTIENAINKMGY